MFYNHQLRASLQEWRNRFLKSDFEDANSSFIFLMEELHNEASIQNILLDLVTEIPYTDDKLEAVSEELYYKDPFTSKRDKISFIYHHCNWLINKNNDFRYLSIFGGSPKDTCDSFKDRFIIPLIDYIHDQLDTVSQVLYILEKYKLRTEWFTRKALLAEYKSAEKNYEELLEEDLRLFLFDQGIDYPFSTPKSASGRADVVSLINTEDPLVLEIKIYDSAKGYRKDRVKSGFAQIVKYAQDYHKDTGYLVIFNMDNIEIEIEGKERDNKWPNRYLFNGKTYYIIFVNLNNDTSASKQGQLNKLTIEFEELIKDI